VRAEKHRLFTALGDRERNCQFVVML